jgi:hypothetical protein
LASTVEPTADDQSQRIHAPPRSGRGGWTTTVRRAKKRAASRALPRCDSARGYGVAKTPDPHPSAPSAGTLYLNSPRLGNFRLTRGPVVNSALSGDRQHRPPLQDRSTSPPAGSVTAEGRSAEQPPRRHPLGHWAIGLREVHVRGRARARAVRQGLRGLRARWRQRAPGAEQLPRLLAAGPQRKIRRVGAVATLLAESRMRVITAFLLPRTSPVTSVWPLTMLTRIVRSTTG